MSRYGEMTVAELATIIGCSVIGNVLNVFEAALPAGPAPYF